MELLVITKYQKAYTEVLEILKYLKTEEYNRIPKEKIRFYKENMDKNYIYSINPQIELSKQSVSNEAYAILVSLFRDYIATERQKEILTNLLNQNQERQEQLKKEKYPVNNIFKNK